MIFLVIFFYCRVNMKDRKYFSDHMNRNRFDPILARLDWSCSIMEILRCLTLLQINKTEKSDKKFFNCVFFLSCHINVLEWMYTLLLSECRGAPCAWNRRDIWSLSNCSKGQFHNHLLHKWTPNHLASLETLNSFTVFMQTMNAD